MSYVGSFMGEAVSLYLRASMKPRVANIVAAIILGVDGLYVSEMQRKIAMLENIVG
jgi:hypothetical protein